VSRSEAGQPKSLLVLDASDWAVAEEIPLDVGPRHFTLALPGGGGAGGDEGLDGVDAGGKADALGASLREGLRRGDRLRLTVRVFFFFFVCVCVCLKGGGGLGEEGCA
jgi:hypothetical protein